MDKTICIFGEVLFDHFPDGKRILGGAPFNVAWHLQAFGQAPRLISRVGYDDEGRTIEQAMRQWGMSTDSLQSDNTLPTGRVSVSLDGGEPHYDIVSPCAYDAIESVSDSTLGCRLLYHGSLALRDERSRHSALQLLEQGMAEVFLDVNLRPPWWQEESVKQMIQKADWLKLNHHELAMLYPQLQPQQLLEHAGLKGLVVTHGERGAELFTEDAETLRVAPAENCSIVDTVGAGDAFTSVMILGLSLQWPLSLTLQRAQSFASAVVSLRGATTTDEHFYQPFIRDWQLQP